MWSTVSSTHKLQQGSGYIALRSTQLPFPPIFRSTVHRWMTDRSENFDPPGTPGHPRGHSEYHWCLGELGDPCFSMLAICGMHTHGLFWSA
ncbi:hypothetical protein AYI69_g7950 [Smittium culicis]|uniref:Uncharacterized protein n=1 Tax=Smittium culicis TaxID=133412 RepID=A0A1R1XNE0_9FUNG|nr:hypothetical protein AYI69_g7950 [Smittium culicis]